MFSQREFRRFYPQGEAVAHVLGFTNIDDRGQEGLELAFDDWLRGKAGVKRVIRDRRGRIVENVDLVRAAEPGHDLTLSIDRRIQFLAYRELKRALLENGASSGSAVVLDVATGEVLAMANLPSYNPNAVDGRNRDARRNRAVTDLIEPGSTMKPITVAAVLEAGLVTPNTRFDTTPGWMPNGRYRTTDTHNYGVLDVTGIITKSSNVGAAKLAAMLPNQDFYDYLKKLGYGDSTQQRLPGRGRRPVPGALALERHHQADHVLRLRPVGDAAADRACLRHARQRRPRDHADLRQGRAHRAEAGDGRRCRARSRADDGDRDAARRHRDPGAHPRLPRRRQDRHRAHRQRRRLLAALRRVLRRAGAGEQPALLDGGGDQRSGSRAWPTTAGWCRRRCSTT